MAPVWRARLLLPAAALPLLATFYQFAASRLARQEAVVLSWWGWAAHLAVSPWTALLLLSEGASFVLWMLVLSELPLSIAFPLTAIGSVLTVVMAVLLLGEPMPPLVLIGGIAILSGAWLVVRHEA